ncbi:E3 SUMO-protein ligase ZBED1-like [Ruditapes philippinarum]|uniref:E3 SUMO-protein ligase ZBED1-like n=1 Tax=Ruditapes philippinarum TaxID=129788 RepID=UPI00295BAF75|nr:E3 SUMO-protein ligase ZBED1-like [Ruditapes philippinarum]
MASDSQHAIENLSQENLTKNMEHEDQVLFNYPTRSIVWKYFGFTKKGLGPAIKANLNMNTAICKLCKKSYANKGNTTNLLFHIDHDHKRTASGDENNNIKKAPTQPTIQALIANPGRLTQKSRTNLDDALLKLIVGKALPISLVKNPHFIEFTKLLDPRCSHNTRRLDKSYSAVTAHFIDDKWNLKSAVLQTKKVEGSHTSEKIAEGLKEVQTEWKLPTSLTLVTDNAANERKAAELLGWTRFGCYGHRINLVVKHALEVTELNKILGKSRRLVTFFHQSTSATDALIEKQKLVFSNTPGLIGHKLITDVPTRWNSTLAMLGRLAEQLPAIMSIIFDTNCLNKTAISTVKTYCLTSEEHSVVQELISVLKSFETATTILCAESSPTMHKVLPCMVKIKKKLEDVESNPLTSPVVKKVILKMKEELLKRTQVEDVPLLAALLNPDTKNLNFLTAEEQVSARQLLMDTALNLKVDNAALPNVKVKQEEAVSANLPDLPVLPDIDLESDQNVKFECEKEGPSEKKMKLTDMDEWFDDVCFIGESQQPLQNLIELEVHRYFSHNQPQSSKQQTLLQWWQANHYFYPQLATLAKKYLAVPASSVPSERVFSLAGIVVDKKRSRLKPDLVDTLIFMKMNIETYW